MATSGTNSNHILAIMITVIPPCSSSWYLPPHPSPLSSLYLGTLPLGTLPENVETLRLPSFDADNPTSLAELVSGLAQDEAPSRTPSQLTPSSYSPTARLPKKLVTRIQARSRGSRRHRMCCWHFGGHHAGLPVQTFSPGQSALHSWQQ